MKVLNYKQLSFINDNLSCKYSKIYGESGASARTLVNVTKKELPSLFVDNIDLFNVLIKMHIFY